MALVLRLTLVLCMLALSGPAAIAQQASDVPAALDRPEPLAEQNPRGEAGEDRVAADALVLQGRLLARREDLAGALRKYQRVWRLDPGQPAILSEITSLAFELKRNEEAARYAVIAAEHAPQDAVLLRRLAMYLTEKRDWKRALALYEKALALKRPRPEGNPLDVAEVTIQLELGRLYFLTDDFARSAAAFGKVQAAVEDPKSPLSAEIKTVVLGKKPARTYSLWAEAFLAAERGDEAAALFTKSHELESDAPLQAFNLARVAASKKDWPEALAKLDEYALSRSTAAGSEPYALLAEAISNTTPDKEQARKLTIDKLEQYRQADADNGMLSAALGEQYFQADRLADAERLFSAARSKQPTGEVYRRLVEIYRRQDKPEALLAVLSELAARTGSLDGLGEMGGAIAAEAAVTDKLLAATARLQKAEPPMLADGQLLAAAFLAREAKRFEDADRFFAAALTETKDGQGEALLRWSLALLMADQHDRAAAALRRILDERLMPGGEASVHFYLAAALELAGHTDDALAAARKSAELSPANAGFAVREGWVLAHAKRMDEARAAYLQAIQQFDSRHDDSSVRQAMREARLALSHIELARDDFPAAAEWLQQVLDEFPEDPSANNDLGYLWTDRGLHLERSLSMIRRAAAAEPDNTSYRDSLGWALFRLGRHADAEQELAKAATGGESGVILDHWGDALSKLGRKDEALSAWRRAEAAFQKAGQTKELEAVRAKIAKNQEPKNQEPR